MPLKHPGEPVPGGDGGGIGEFKPFKWQSAQTGALPVSVLVCVYVALTQGTAWGALTAAPWQPAVFMQEVSGIVIPPRKSPPWQIWHILNPVMV